MIRLNGKLSIGMVFGGDDSRPIRIELLDTDSGCGVVEIRVGLKEFSECITGRGHVECEFDFNDGGTVGTIREHKTEQIPLVRYDYDKRQSAARMALEPFELNGWKGRDYDYLNHHNHHGKFASVIFERFIPREKS